MNKLDRRFLKGGADKKLDKIRNTKEDNYLVLR